MKLGKISNLTSFLQSITPFVYSKSFPEDTTEYFTLGGLWNCYEESSAYGVGAPIALRDNVPVTQYYVPYLSAIQIYTIKSPTTLSKNLSGDNNVDEKDLSRTFNNSSSNFNRLGYLYFEFSEVAALTWRIPLVDKVLELSKKYPGIKTLKSTDLSPASWMAITWVPITQIPMKEITKKVSTYFLTYHTISSIFQENINNKTGEEIPPVKRDDGCIPLLPFGIASYKMQNDIWLNNTQACVKYGGLQSAADSWLKQLNFNHYDFNVFTSKSNNMDHIYFF